MKLFPKKKSRFKSLMYVQRPTRFRIKKKKKNRKPLKLIHTKFTEHLSKFIQPKVLFVCLTVILIGTMLGLVFFSTFFHVSDIFVIRRDVYVHPGKVEEALTDLRGRSLLLISEKELEDSLLSTFPSFSEVEVKKLYPKSLQIRIQAYPIVARVKNQGLKKEFYLNSNGVVVINENEEEEPDTDLMLIEVPLYQDLYEKHKDTIGPLVDITPQKVLFSKPVLGKFNAIMEKYKRNFTYKITGITYLPIEEELHLQLESGTKLYVQISKDIDTQFYKLKAAENNIVLETGEVAYVDLRITNKIHVCKSGDACSK